MVTSKQRACSRRTLVLTVLFAVATTWLDAVPTISARAAGPATPPRSGAGVETAGGVLPAFVRVEAPLVSPEAAREVLSSPDALFKETLLLAGSECDITPEIEELARGLRNDPRLMYEFVRNHIDYVPIYGSVKGATMTLLDRRGNDFDQASLLVALLRASGRSPSYIYGWIRLYPDQIANWLGISTTPAVVGKLLGSGGIPAQVYVNGSDALAYVDLEHVWVKVAVDGTDYVFDPSFKTYSYASGIALGGAMGYDQATFLANATAGGTVTTDYVEDLNTNNIHADLASFGSNLISDIRTTMPDATLADIVGGREIEATEGAPLQTTLPYQLSVIYTWTDIPSSYKTYLRIQHVGIDQNLESSQIYGKRLTLFYNASDRPELRLDGTILATGNIVIPDSYNSITLSVNHPYAANGGTYCDQSITTQIKAGGSYVIVNGWAGTGRRVVEKHRRTLVENKAAGGADSSEPVLGETLSMISTTWLAETTRVWSLTDSVVDTSTTIHHCVGFCGQTESPYIDVPMCAVSVISGTADAAAENASFFVQGGIASAMEWGVIQQMQPFSAVSTVKLIDMANSRSDKLYDARSSNYPAIKPLLRNYSTAEFTGVENYINAGYRVILPEDGDQTEGSWVGLGFLAISADEKQIGHIISGGLKGGFGTTAAPADTTVPTVSAVPALVVGALSQEPIDLVNGDYLFDHADLAVGSGPYPFTLSFARHYNSRNRLSDGVLGLGWTHTFDITARADSDGFQGLGEDSPIDAAAAIAEIHVAADLLRGSKTNARVVAASLSHRWVMDQLIGNVTAIREPQRSRQFVKLPDGTYNPPPGLADVLTKEPDSTYHLRAKDGVLLDFDATGKLSTWSDPNANAVSLAYDSGKLQSVGNGLGRSFTFAYTGNRLDHVSDSAGRTVHYGYDAAGNLTTATDCNGKDTTFAYDIPGRLTQIFYPSRPSSPYVTNVYDSLGRVATQTNASGQTCTYYFSGYRADEADPLGHSQVLYFNDRGKTIREIDRAGNATSSTYDVHDRLTSRTFPEGNAVEYEYDANHNPITTTLLPKPGSSEDPVVTHGTYEPTYSRVETSTDALGRSTTYTYDTHANLLQIDQPETDAQVPRTTFTYNTRGQVLTVADAAGRTKGYTYDAVTGDPLSTTIDPGGLDLTTQMLYDTAGNNTEVTDPRGSTTTLQYDAMRRLTQVTAPSPLSYVTKNTYDEDGHLTKIERQTGDPLHPWETTLITYTPTGQKETVTDPLGHVTGYEYDAVDRLWKTTDAENHVTERLYDTAGRIFQVIDALSNVVEEHTYTANGRANTLEDANGNVTTYQYDDFDRLWKVVYPDTAFEQFTYDAAGNLTHKRTRAGQVIDSTYDELNRVATKTVPGVGTTEYGYDLSGVLTDVTDAGGTIHHDFDGAGRLTGTTYPGAQGVGYEYDAAGNRTKLTHPDGYWASSAYDAMDRPVEMRDPSSYARPDFDFDGDVDLIDFGHFRACFNGSNSPPVQPDCDDADFDHDNDVDLLDFGVFRSCFNGSNVPPACPVGGPVTAYAYDALSRRTAAQYPNSTTASYAYDEASRLTSLVNDVAPADLTRAYTHDNVGNRLTMTVNGTEAHGYTYDAVYRVTAVDYPAGFFRPDAAYDYDPADNRESVTAGGTTAYVPNNLNQYATVGGVTYQYDANGNLTGDGVNTYTYDAENRLTAATAPGHTAAYVYDPFGRRLSKTVDGVTTRYVYDGQQVIAECNAAGAVLRRFVYGPGIDQPIRMDVATTPGGPGFTKYYYHFDGLGNVIALSNATGTIVEQYAYDAYGLPSTTGTVGNPYLFNARNYDAETDLYYYRARYYDPRIGRFLQPDPMEYRAGLNLYAYCGDNPLNFLDPFGLVDWNGWFLWSTGGESSRWEQHRKTIDRACQITGTAAAVVGTAGIVALYAGPAVAAEVVITGTETAKEATRSEEPALPPEAWDKNAPRQVTPGTPPFEHTKYNPATGEWEKSTVTYDDYGRQVHRTDYTDHGYPDDHTIPHDHQTEYNRQYPNGYEHRK